MGFFGKIGEGLRKTRDSMKEKLDDLFGIYKKIDDDLLDELEETLVLSDVGGETSMRICDELRRRVKENGAHDAGEVRTMLREIVAEMTAGDCSLRLGTKPSVILVIGVNGAGKTRGTDVIICDTAGRLQNKKNLMDELSKISRVISREAAGCDVEILLVLDATTGQNALNQARQFKEAAGLTGIVLTKLDGTAKGGVIIGIIEELKIPVKFVGVGEKIEDLQPFDPEEFAAGMFGE